MTGSVPWLSNAGKPLVKLVPVEARKPRTPGRFAGMHVPDEAMAPLSDEETALFYR